MKELFLHIGLSKTGSSAIQSWLSLNVDKLKKQGFDYADLSPSAKKGKITAGNGVALFHACNQKDWLEVERLISKVYFLSCKKSIISSETLQEISLESIKRIQNICDQLSIKVSVIAYARSVYELLYSNYLQGVKRHGFTFNFGEREKLSYSSQRTFLQNYYSIFVKQLKLVNYDSVSKDIFSSFANCIGFNSSELLIKDKKVNRSLTFTESQVLIDLNKIHKGVFSCQISDYLIENEPEKLTSVFYQNDLIGKVTLNSSDDLFWINENIVPLGGDIKISITDKQSDVVVDDYVAIMDNVIKWVLQYETNVHKVEFIDFIRDLAVFLEKKHVKKSLLLMEKARELRPNGPFILKRIDIYNHKLSLEKS
ncbi:hypothetical protein AADZ84_11125 [Colwelliaceae bacterium MEBiC 14330]